MAMAVEPQVQQAGSTEWTQEEKSREVRLGVVMYGGISLAIYINGVSQGAFPGRARERDLSPAQGAH